MKSPHSIDVVFLDIDGVMNSIASVEMVRAKRLRCANFPGTSHITGHPSTVWSYFAPWSVEALNHITDTTGAQIVISSTWRETAIPYLRRWGVRGNIIGQTPILDRWTTGGILMATTRGEEIAAWFDKWSRVPGSRPVASFVILDDDAEMGELLPRLVQTEADGRGLTMTHAHQAVSLLEQRDQT